MSEQSGPGRSGPEQPSRVPGFAEWSALHGNAAPTGLVGGWLRFVYLTAKPLVLLRISPHVVTFFGLLVGVCALVPAAGGSRWPLLAAALIGLSALLDGLDGAVAVLSSRVSSFGARLDRVCDRCSDVCFAACLGLAGGFWVWWVAGACCGLLHEFTRSWARHRGMTSIGVVTVSERPTRVLVAAMFVLAAGVYPASAGTWSTAGGIVMAGAGALGLLQLVVAVRRGLS
ncbi:CDP-alcohol phosphatidyltransferase family protein [Kineosporia mesophila]|uniref:CDP-alcohol phosphatidyltransferase family protein n=1 Tax=Kineosporia mesophila TaxID=566012 RepID=A0ABP7A7B2_9ACTN|nr:CDP-alcohol phosphatidyltransferase family protein [Kineosporia mesophila]MCD5351629.1 CDP-alcohol phosphatidyltransferase family protein [Kineosporia mesophila]